MTNSVWKQKNFMLLWSGQLVSWMGTEVSGIALPLVVLALTGSPAKAGMVAAIRGLTYVIWSLPAGALVDRWDRRLVMVVSNAGSGVAIGSIALLLKFHHLSLSELYILCAVEGSCFVFANLSRFAALPKVVSKEQFPTASAQMGTGNQAAILVGPALGGFLFQMIGSFATFLADSVSYFVNAISIFFITVPLKTETVSERRAMHIEVKEAFDWYRKQPVIRLRNRMTAGRIGVEAALYLLIVVLAKHHHASSLAIGLIFAIAAVGGMVGSSLAPKIHSNYKLKQLLLGVSIVSTIAFCLYGFANSVAVIAVVTALYYAVDPLFHVTTSSYSAKVIPDNIRGRVVSLTRLQVLAANSLGFFLVGQALEHLSTATTTYLLAAFLFLLSIAIAANPRLSHIKYSI
jgi:predicted MFS family arabinose efflux permease